MDKWTEKHPPTFPQPLLRRRRYHTPSKRQVQASGLPHFIILHQQGTDQPQASGFVGEDAHHPGPALDFPVHSLQPVGGADQPAVVKREIEDRETIRQIFLQPGG